MKREAHSFRKGTALVTAVAFAWALGLGAGSVSGAAPPAAESPLQIDHDPLKCVNTDYAPKVDAAVAPGRDLDKGYVYFRAAGTEDFYYAVMKGAPENLEGVLPRPLPETRAIDYKIRATDVQSLAKEKGEFTPPVVPGNACKVEGAPVGPGGAKLTIGLTREGQNPVPPGFNRKDIAFVILATGAIVTLASLSAGGGAASGAGAAVAKGGISKGAIIAGGGAAAAGAAIAIANSGSKATATPLPTATPVPTPTPTPFVFVEADATWSGMGDVDVQVLNSSGQPVGTPLPAGCESTNQRTEHVVLQGPPAGTYRVVLSAKSCGAGTPSSISVVVSVQSSGQPKCANTFVNVPVGGNATGCTFTLP
jgi:hypothetical protein